MQIRTWTGWKGKGPLLPDNPDTVNCQNKMQTLDDTLALLIGGKEVGKQLICVAVAAA